MDYVGNLIKAQKHLIKKVRELQSVPQDFYYEKYLKLNEENLALKEQISRLETQIYTLNREITKKSAELRALQS